MDNKPRVGIAALIIDKSTNKVLLGKRIGSHGSGSWAAPGGHLEFGESFEQCVVREVKEETSLVVENIRFGAVTNDIFLEERKHYITIFMICSYKSGTAQVMEPEKCEKWEWFAWDELPQPLFLSLQNLLKQNFRPSLTD